MKTKNVLILHLNCKKNNKKNKLKEIKKISSLFLILTPWSEIYIKSFTTTGVVKDDSLCSLKKDYSVGLIDFYEAELIF